MTGTPPPVAFVSWAHRGHGWTAQQESDWAQSVSEFTAQLRLNGVDADVDLYHQHERGQNWNRYGLRAINDRDLVFVAVSHAWIQRFDGTEDPTSGAGAAREADALMDLYNSDRAAFEQKVALVYLPTTDTRDVPSTLGGLQRFYVADLSASGLEDVLRFCHDAPRHRRPALGPPPPFADPTPADGAEQSLQDLRAALSTTADQPAADATARGITAALTSHAGSTPMVDNADPSAPTATATAGQADDEQAWEPLPAPIMPIGTMLETSGRTILFGPMLEVQLLTTDDTPRFSTPAFRALAARVVADWTAPAAPADPTMGGRITPPIAPTAEMVNEALTVTTTPSRMSDPFGGARSVWPAQPAQLTLLRNGSVAVTLYLAHDTFSAIVNTQSLTRDIAALIDDGMRFLPASVETVVPVVRIGPLQQVSPGDPAELGSNRRGLPWSSAMASTAGIDSIARGHLSRPGTAAELTAQLVAELR